VDDRVRLYELMTEVGFDPVATEVYGVVLTCGPLPRRGILSILSDASTRIDGALSLLRERGLVGRLHRRLRRRQFYATPPDIAWPALSSQLLWSTTDDAAGTRPSPVARDPAMEARRRRYAEIAAVAGRLHRPYAAALAHQEWDAGTTEEFAQLICELIAQARTSVVAVSKSPRLPQVASFWATLSDRMARGVSYRRVVDLDEVIDHGLKFARRDIDDHGIDLRVLEHDRIQHKYYVVDRSFLAVFHSRPHAPESGRGAGVGRVTSRGTIVRRYARRFRDYASVAIPGDFVVRCMEAAAHGLLRVAEARLTAEEAAWVESLVHYGKFSRFHVSRGWSEDELTRVEQRAIGIGVVRRNLEGAPVPAYPVTERDIRANYENGASSIPALPGPGDQPGAALPGDIGPGPVEQDQEAVAEPDQEHDVHEEPREPRDEP